MLTETVKGRDEQIAELKEQIEALQAQSLQTPSASDDQLVQLLQKRIAELESEKARQESEDRRQDNLIDDLQQKLANQERRFQRMLQQVRNMIPNSRFTPSIGSSDPENTTSDARLTPQQSDSTP